MQDAAGSRILIVQLLLTQAIVFGVSQLCALYVMWSKCRYLVSRLKLPLHWTAKDLGDCDDDSTALQSIFCNKTLPSSLRGCHHIIIGKHHWVQKWRSLHDHVIWWMNGLVDIIIEDVLLLDGEIYASQKLGFTEKTRHMVWFSTFHYCTEIQILQQSESTGESITNNVAALILILQSTYLGITWLTTLQLLLFQIDVRKCPMHT